MSNTYFTYKLLQKVDGGYSPKRNVSQDWLNCGLASKPDGTMLGISTRALNESFVADDISADPVTDYQVAEITEVQALQFCTDCGMNDPAVDGTSIKDNNPSYQEGRGRVYVRAVEAVAVTVNPGIVEPEK